MRGSVRLCWTGSRTAPTFWRRARNRIGSGGRRKSEISRRKRRRAKATSCGNDGPWKEWKTQEQVFHSSHRPWKSARAADSHIHHSYGGGDGSGCGSPHTASLKQQHPKVGRNKPPKWAKRSCQTQGSVSWNSRRTTRCCFPVSTGQLGVRVSVVQLVVGPYPLPRTWWCIIDTENAL